jgi:hypothetical protein
VADADNPEVPMRRTLVAALAVVAGTTLLTTQAAASSESAERRHHRCAAEFDAAVKEDNDAYAAKDPARYEAILNPRMIFWYNGRATYGRDAIMATARQSFATPGWIWTYTILSETVYGCESGIAVIEAHVIFPETGVDRHYSATMGLVREHGKWTVAIDNVYLFTS